MEENSQTKRRRPPAAAYSKRKEPAFPRKVVVADGLAPSDGEVTTFRSRGSIVPPSSSIKVFGFKAYPAGLAFGQARVHALHEDVADPQG